MRCLAGRFGAARGQFQESLLEDFRQSGVDVEDVVGEFVDPLSEHHCLHQRLEEC